MTHAGHAHTPQNFGRAFAWGIGLNTLYVVVEAVVGLSIGSLGLVADAGHNASDVLSLMIAWAAARLAQRPPSEHFTYGLKRSPIVASLFNALLLFGAMGIVFWEALERLQNPTPISGTVIIWVTLVGLVVNFGTAYLFAKGQGDLNIRGAFFTHDGRRSGHAGRLAGRYPDHLYGRGLARPGDQPGHRGSSAVEYVGALSGTRCGSL